ncbi:hypothetical protein HBI56_168510 [Parastagonospora nodorum]|nr:hypothetical protein HBH50_234550 [Parastagonospora nodorum]KAH4079186.1 hypothetical protein HBH48_220510 [Parastagonospora nodorum]KAH4107542.1 hypothetical protein HBH46_054160 [Parastagonospora nodorum]KAH4176473.1 hypothetical protein HBH43_059130 [Parastagonospora nodorum]KAH4252811.1 hypothetical protein HBI03_204250 [Parastagonospora nodorum]
MSWAVDRRITRIEDTAVRECTCASVLKRTDYHSSSTRQLYTDSATMRFIFGPNVQPMDCYPESRYDHKDGLFFTTVEYDCSDWGILEGQAIFESNLSPASGPLAINYTSEISGRNVENEGLLRILVRNSVPRNYQCM